MEGLFFAIGFLLGGVVGVLIMCLLQINRIDTGNIKCGIIRSSFFFAQNER